jgi:hypothetical protein
MPLPVWIVAIRDPAYAYMLRSSGVRRPRAGLRRRRVGNFSVAYAPFRRPTAEEIQELHSRGEEKDRLFMVRLREVEERHGELLRRTAVELMRVGTATLRTSEGDIEAHIIRFPKEAVVLEIHFPGGRSQNRTSQSSVRDQAFHQLANALISTRPEAEPRP